MNQDELNQQIIIYMANYLVSCLRLEPSQYATKELLRLNLNDKDLSFELWDHTLNLKEIVLNSLNTISSHTYALLGNSDQNVQTIIDLIKECSASELASLDLLKTIFRFELGSSLSPLKEAMYQIFIKYNKNFEAICDFSPQLGITSINLERFHDPVFTNDKNLFFSLISKHVELTLRSYRFASPERVIISELLQRGCLFKLKTSQPLSNQFMRGLISFLKTEDCSGAGYLQREALEFNYAINVERTLIEQLNNLLNRNHCIAKFISKVTMLTQAIKRDQFGVVTDIAYTNLKKEYKEFSTFLSLQDSQRYQEFEQLYQEKLQNPIKRSTPTDKSLLTSFQNFTFEEPNPRKRKVEEASEAPFLPSKKPVFKGHH